MTDAVIFDVDGTLLDNSHRLHYIRERPRDWNKYTAAIHDDSPIENVIRIARMYVESYDPHDITVLALTGRNEREREATLSQFHRFAIPISSNNLYMRPDNNFDRDDDFKRLELWALRELGYNVTTAFEDRTRCVEMYRNQGVTCLQVGNGDF